MFNTIFKVYENKTWVEYTQDKLPYDINDYRVCKPTGIMDNKNQQLYTGDIVDLIYNDNESITLIVLYYKGSIKLSDCEIYLNGISFCDLHFNHHLIGNTIVNSSCNIIKIGNIFENNMNEFIDKLKEV